MRPPFSRELPGDLETPVSAYIKLGNRPFSYLLESMQGGERWGRYSFIGLPCRSLIRVFGDRVICTEDEVITADLIVDDPIAWLKNHTGGVVTTRKTDGPRFAGGWVGYFGYDCVRYFEPRLRPSCPPDTLGTPDILLMRSDELVMFDSLRGTLTLLVHAIDESTATGRLDAIEAQLAQPVPTLPTLCVDPPQFTSGFGADAFRAAVAKIQDYIAAGDCMQVVPSQRMSAPFAAEPLALYRAIRRLNPSPYLFCLHLGDHHVIGSSPELQVRVEDGEATVRPLAGTRPRGATPEADAALAAELLADPKELAEHLMLIDLGRNDVGRVAETGAVRLTEKMVIERYSHVMHIVSNVVGTLKVGTHALDVLAASFPAGTLSGAPKVRAMEIIDEVEPVKRGIYGGAVGYLGFDGDMDVAIAIRTAVIKDGEVHIQAGAGIVADSDPESEWQETLAKARAMIRAVELAHGG